MGARVWVAWVGFGVLLGERSDASLPQNYRLSQEPAIDWVEDVERFEITGGRVVYDIRGRGFRYDPRPSRIWSVGADGRNALLLHDASIDGEEPLDWYLSPDRRWLVYLVWSAGRAHLVARRTDGSRRLDFEEVERPYHLTFSPDSTRIVFVAWEGLFSLLLEESAEVVTLTRTDEVDGKVRLLQVSPDGTRVVYISDEKERYRHEVYSVPILGETPPRPLSQVLPGASVHGFRIAPDSRSVTWIAYTGRGNRESALWAGAIDGNSPALRLTDPTVESVSTYTFAPDGEHVLYRPSYPQGRLEEVSIRTGARRTVLDLAAPLALVRFTEDGRFVYFTAAGELFRLPLRTGAPVRLHPALGEHVAYFRLAPDERSLVFSTPTRLFTVPSDGSKPPLVLASAEYAQNFVFTPDASRVYFTTRGEFEQLFTVPRDGSEPARWIAGTATIPFEFSFALTADGQRVVYRARDNIDVLQLWSTDALGGNRLRLNDALQRGARGDVYEVALDPSGRIAYYQDIRGGPEGGGQTFDLWQVLLDDPRHARSLAKFTTHPSLPGVPWPLQVSRDGRWLAYGFDSANTLPTFFVRSTESDVVVSTGRCLAPPILSEDSRFCFVDQDERLLGLDLSRGGIPVVLGEKVPVQNWPSVRSDPTGSFVVYARNVVPDDSGGQELWSTRLDAPYSRAKISGTLVSGGSVSARSPQTIGLTERHAIYVADAETEGVRELFRTPLDGSSAPEKLSAPMVNGGGVFSVFGIGPSFRLSPDGSFAVYVAEQETDDQVELYRVEVLRPGSVTRLSGPLIANGDVGGGLRSGGLGQIHEISRDGRQVLYLADAEVDQAIELWVVPADGSAAPTRLNAALGPEEWVADFGIGPDGRFAYRVETGRSDREELRLFAGRIDGSAPVRELAPEVPWVGGFGSDDPHPGFSFTPDGQTLLFFARPGERTSLGIFAVPSDGAAPAHEVSGPMVLGGRVEGPEGKPRLLLTRDGSRVLYIADQETNEVHALFAAFLRKTPRRK